MQTTAMQSSSQQNPSSMQQQNIDQESKFEDTQEVGEYSINPDQIEEHIRQQMNDKQEKQMNRLLDEGNNLLFGKETHYQLLNGLEKSNNIAKDLGEGAYGMMMMLIRQGANIPGEIIIPTGAILISRVASFLNESGMIKVSDDDFAASVETFGHLIMQHDPQFMERMKQNTGQIPGQGITQSTDMATGSDGQNAGQAPLQRQGGLLNMTGRSGG